MAAAAAAGDLWLGNGNKGEPITFGMDIMKVLVVGDRGCGKSAFINSFSKVFEIDEEDHPVEDAAKVYKCDDVEGWHHVARRIFFYELNGSEETENENLRQHCDSNIVVIMYAVDDPTSFEHAKGRWRDSIDHISVLERFVCAVVVGNKKDLRENQQVIQSLAQIGESPITIAEGKSILNNYKIKQYFDCSSIEPYTNTKQVLDWVLDFGKLLSEV